MTDMWFSVKDATKYLNVSRKTVQKIINNGKNPQLRIMKVGNQARILKSSIDKCQNLKT